MKKVDCVRLVLFVLALVILPLACDAGGIVGGTCRDGGTICDGVCVDLTSNPFHCGECGTVCLERETCDQSECKPISTGGSGGTSSGDAGRGAEAGDDALGGAGASTDGGASGSSGRGGAGGRGGSSGRGGANSSGDGGSAGDGVGACVPPFDTAEQCGDCDTQCSAPTPLCAPDDMGGYSCVPACDPPLVACGDQCVDVNVHPLHCGRCNNACPSGICQGGQCVGATTGHVALYCMNFAAVLTQSAHAVLLGNAVFLPLTSEVRILAFSRWAPASERSRVDALIRATGDQRGRTVNITNVTNAAELSNELRIQDYDVFLIYEQTNAPAGELAGIGAAWRNSMVLESFARAGGVVVVLDGAQGTGEMAEFIDAAGLLELDGHQPIALDDTTTRFYNRAPGDVLGVNVLSPMSPMPYSCTFDTPVTSSADTVFVVTDAASPDPGSPVVVHRVFAP